MTWNNRKRLSVRPSRPRRRAFTLVELIVAGMITAMLVGSIGMTVAHLGRAKTISARRAAAYLRADSALDALRRDVCSVLRTDDLFFTRVFLHSDQEMTPAGEMDRGELLLFTTYLRPSRDLSQFNGEGIEYETQYRVEEDELGTVLWQRRDPMPDEYPAGGGLATPIVEGVVGLRIECYDGDAWWEEWDSDYDGIPTAVRVTVTASGAMVGEPVFSDDAPLVVLRTVVPIDRVLEPRDHAEAEEALLMEQEELERQEREAAEQAEGEDGEGTGIPGMPGGVPGRLPGDGGGLGGDPDGGNRPPGTGSGGDPRRRPGSTTVPRGPGSGGRLPGGTGSGKPGGPPQTSDPRRSQT